MQKYIQIRHDFTPDELLQMGDSLAERLKEKTDVENEKKREMSRYRDRVTVLNVEIERLRTCVSDKFELREERCTVKLDREAGIKRYYHAETGQHVLTEKMTPDDFRLFDEDDD